MYKLVNVEWTQPRYTMEDVEAAAEVQVEPWLLWVERTAVLVDLSIPWAPSWWEDKGTLSAPMTVFQSVFLASDEERTS